MFAFCLFSANCGENEKYVPYLTLEQPSCKDPNPSQESKYSPEEGCLCADGYVLDNAQEGCIPLEECGCVTEDNYYAVRSMIRDLKLSIQEPSTRFLLLLTVLKRWF